MTGTPSGEDPHGEHLAKTPLDVFEQEYREAVRFTREHGGNPVLLTLPPIDAHRYFNWFTQGENVENILQWLGDIDRIYRWHEMYNLAVCRVAMQEGVLLLDISSRFLERSHYEELLCEDGIHPNEKRARADFLSLSARLPARLLNALTLSERRSWRLHKGY